MQLALSLGARGLGNTWPNPAVGCVIVRDDRIVGRGWTQPGGRPHAEVVALSQAGAAAKGATAYVTLEPCSHHGKSPPCADALIAAGIARVVVALTDPDPRVDGGGLAGLRHAGIDVVTGVCEDAARRSHSGFLSRVQQGRPMLSQKLASSFDGRIATGAGESQWITGPDARRVVHGMRARHDAVLIGGATARADDPELTVRGQGAVRQPVRVVLSRGLDLPVESRLVRNLDHAQLWLVHGHTVGDAKVQSWEALGARCLPVLGTSTGLDVLAVMKALAEQGLTRVFSESGGTLTASLLRAGLVDELIGFSAGLVIGADGRPSIGDMSLKRLADAPRFDLQESRVIGGDVMHRWVRRAG
ncbi:bifunctional diaminohydroxyphosphoribosylaminopyrimidine deaminase/5-amino-6-(5-phosphoribosylamino)uracil reductase RibD [Qingshengfaniella alkalisoli]|uniref:Riboflavin biosynthesis protein RibD n=2 Tax=Qingshengfaniella alkalisoli TaxID=2599296 RepID=A0A5B8I8C5_9RHOB|nr:bifunctional diaminohydroxyphosphoribosylaminopyrimidine deaminase/5-amino-6-(5-phosphoribosylamino)uracil reductase RibD [Qingshengfaniella alkalisoli]